MSRGRSKERHWISKWGINWDLCCRIPSTVIQTSLRWWLEVQWALFKMKFKAITMLMTQNRPFVRISISQLRKLTDPGSKQKLHLINKWSLLTKLKMMWSTTLKSLWKMNIIKFITRSPSYKSITLVLNQMRLRNLKPSLILQTHQFLYNQTPIF